MSDLTPETRSLLARGRQGHALPEGRRQGLKRTVLLRIAGGAVVASTVSATALAAKVVAVALLVGALGGGVASVVGSRGRAQALAPLRAATPASSERAAPVATTPSVAIASPVAIDPGQAPSAETPATTATAANPRPAPALAPVSSAIPPPVPSLQAEARLLLEAHRALNEGDAATALRLLGEHAVRFPGSALEPERAAERVLALCAAGRTIDARREARVFVALHGPGPLALRVQRSCGGGE